MSEGTTVVGADQVKTRLDALDALYAELPALACQRKCAESCGPIAMSLLEYQRVLRWSGRTVLTVKTGTNLSCPLLRRGLCSVHVVRPMICHLWGLTPKMACPFGCVPSFWLTEEETKRYLDRAVALSEGRGIRVRIEDEHERAQHAVDVQARGELQTWLGT